MSEFIIKNTQVNGNALLSNLSVDASRAMAFQNGQGQREVAATAAGVYLSVNDLVQSTIGTLLVSGTGTIYVGPDSADQASAYQNLFGMVGETGVERVLRFCITQDNSRSGDNINLANSSGTYNNVIISGLNVLSGVPATGYNSILFNASAAANAATGCSGDGAGYERIVILKSESAVPGNEKVSFHVLPGSK